MQRKPVCLELSAGDRGSQALVSLAAFLRSYCLCPEKNVEEGMIQLLITEPRNQVVFWAHTLTALCRID